MIRSLKPTLVTSRLTVPDSIFDRSRMSLMSDRRSDPAAWIVLANSFCLSDRLPSGFSVRSFDRIRSEFSGVRSSWLILARNCDL